MANRTQETILEEFLAVSGRNPENTAGADGVLLFVTEALPDALKDATQAFEGLAGAARAEGATTRPAGAERESSGAAPAQKESISVTRAEAQTTVAGPAQGETTVAAPADRGTTASARGDEGTTGAVRAERETIVAATRALTAESRSTNSGETSAASKALNAVLKTGLGFVPLVQGLLRIFGGGSTPEELPLVKYPAPAAIRFEKALSDGVVIDADYDQTGAVRTARPSRASARQDGGGSRPESEQSPRPERPEEGRAIVNVNVQAMDSRSFLDHSDEIARAVREAMLNLNPMNDVLNEI